MSEELEQSQVVAPEGEADLAGAFESQPEVAPEGEQPGAEAEPQKPVDRIYTQAEWSERESAKDTEAAGLRQALTQQYMQQQIAQAQAAEVQAQAADRRAVDEGEITTSDAAQRQQQRQQAWQQQQAYQQQMQTAKQAMAQAEGTLRMEAGFQMAKDYEIDPAELLGDKSLISPALMEAKAAKLALEKTKGELKTAKTGAETFDSGQVGSVGVSLTNLSPEEKVAYGLAHPPKRKA